MQEEKKPWHECTNKECKCIFDVETLDCPSCETENPEVVDLTLREVVERVALTTRGKVWTRQPGRFDELEEALKKEARTTEAVKA